MTRLAAFSIAAGIGSALALRSPSPLADPNSCPGILDFLAVVASRTWRDVPLGSMLTAGNAVVVFVALLLLACAVYRVTSVVGIALVITLAASLSPLFEIALAPSAAAAAFAIIAAWVAVLHARTRAVVLLALATAVVFVFPLIVQVALPSGSAASSFGACMPPASGSAAGRALVAILAANPLVTALAALGLISIRAMSRDVLMSLVVGAVVSPWCVLWLLAAAGLSEVWKVRGKVGTVVLAAVLVALQGADANARRKATSPADGHARLTLAMVSTLVNSVPRGAAIVAEDASVDLLTRALPSRLRSADRFRFVTVDPVAIAEALRTTRVFALPRSQRRLQQMAVEFTDASSAGASGLAEIRQVHECSGVLSDSPTSLPSIAGLRQFALVAGNEHSRDSIVIMLTGEIPLSVAPLDWPPQARRGLHARIFDRTLASDERDFAEELRTYALLPWSRPQTRYVTRIEAWRTPGAPLVLPLTLGGPASSGTARRLGSSPNQDLRLCPSFPYEVRPLTR